MTSRTFSPRTYPLVLATFLVMIVATTASAAQGGLQAVATSPTSITLNWTAPGDDGTTGTAALYDIRYSTVAITSTNWSSCTQVSNAPTPHAAGTKETFDVTGLASNTSYYFAIKVADEAGNWSGLSNVINKTTPQETTPPAAIGNLTAPTTTTTSVTLAWTAPGDDGSVGTAKTYDIRYATTAITDANWSTATQASGETAPKAAGGSETFTVSGLATGQTYYFAIKTADEVPNWSLLSNVVSKATGQETTPPAAITNLTPGTVTASSVALTWTAPGDDGTTGTATTYDLRYAVGPITDANWSSATQVTNETAPKVAGSSESYTVTGLNAATVYYFALKAADDVGNWSSLSNVPNKATATAAIAPAAITNLGAGSETATSVTLSWTAPGDDGNTGTAAQYDVRYSTSPITTSNWASATYAKGEPAPKPAGTAQTFVVTELTPNTTYYFAITTADADMNWSSLSNVASRTTAVEATPPANIANLAATASTDTTVTLTWTAPGDDSTNGTAKTYDIRYSTSPITDSTWASATQVDSETVPKVAGSAETFVVKKLALGTTYYFAIKTADEIPNWSGLSNVVSRATTGDNTPPAQIQDLSLLPGTREGQLTLHWTTPGDDALTGRAVAYTIRYSNVELNSSTWSDAPLYANPPNPLMGGSVQTFTMTGLTPGQTYWVGIVATDDAGHSSAVSNIASGQARIIIATGTDHSQIAAVIAPAPNSVMKTSRPQLTVANITAASGLTYHFEVAHDSTFASVVASADVEEDESGMTEWRVETPLQSLTTYYWRVQAGSYAYGPTASFIVDPSTHPYPNPFAAADAPNVTFTDVPEGADLIVLSPSGEQVRYWSAISGGDVVWDGTNESGHHVASGTYLWFVANSDIKGKIVVLR